MLILYTLRSTWCVPSRFVTRRVKLLALEVLKRVGRSNWPLPCVLTPDDKHMVERTTSPEHSYFALSCLTATPPRRMSSCFVTLPQQAFVYIFNSVYSYCSFYCIFSHCFVVIHAHIIRVLYTSCPINRLYLPTTLPSLYTLPLPLLIINFILTTITSQQLPLYL